MSEIPASFEDIPKKCKDLFKKGFNFGVYKLEVENSAKSDVKFSVDGNLNSDTGHLAGSFQVEKKFPDSGVKIFEKWESDNKINTVMSIEDALLKGSKATLDITFFPLTSAKSAKLKTVYKRDYVHAGVNVDLDMEGATVHGHFVTGYKGWLAGIESSFDAAKSTLLSTNFIAGYKADEFQVHTKIQGYNDFSGGYYHKLSAKSEVGVDLGWNIDNNVRFGVGHKYLIDKNSHLNSKVDNKGHIGIGYTNKLTDAVTLTLSSLIDSKNFAAGGHKVGMALKFDN